MLRPLCLVSLGPQPLYNKHQQFLSSTERLRNLPKVTQPRAQSWDPKPRAPPPSSAGWEPEQHNTARTEPSHTTGGQGGPLLSQSLSLDDKGSESADLINLNPSSLHKTLVPCPKFKQLLRQCNGTRMSEEFRVLIIKVLMKI